ncbi:hypothetical protein PIROE2DRAFT_8819 [Piromyces sp. E2]|nr:hypothetical protein PIROE2DRAFT_8819 [Piromyces sp. E2]|eukprot:OUM64430.1 hypothetical protein PIROE2DRAFT_8819 [Piromyces sp. E2]
MKGVRQGCPLSPILFNFFINDVFKDCENFGVKIGKEYCCGGLFADDIVLSIDNNMTFGIDKCVSMVVRPNTPLHQGRRDPTFYLGNKKILKITCYTYLGIPFDNTSSLKPVIDSMKNKVRKAYYIVGSKDKNSFVSLYTLTKELNIPPLSAKCALTQNHLGGRRNNNKNKTEWENLCKHQLKSGSLSDIPFLAKTAAFFNTIIPIVSGQGYHGMIYNGV